MNQNIFLSLPPDSPRGGSRTPSPFWRKHPSHSRVIIWSKWFHDKILWKEPPISQVRMADKLPRWVQGFSSSSLTGLCRHASYQKYSSQMPVSTGVGVFAWSRCWTPCGRGRKDWVGSGSSCGVYWALNSLSNPPRLAWVLLWLLCSSLQQK